jgi:predicted kinase
MSRLIRVRNPRTIVALSGVPGSGKSTFIRDLVREYPEHNWHIAHPDAVREELTGDVNDQSRNKEVWATTYERLGRAAEEGRPIIFDATLASPYVRKQVVQSVPGDYERILVRLGTSLEESLRRNKSRDRVVPEDVIRRMYASLEKDPPGEFEGWTRIIRV